MSPSLEQRLAVCQRPAGLPIMKQRWAGLLFLHWEVDAAVIQKRLPAGLYVDLHEGMAWLGVIPFFMERVRPVGLPPVPWLSWFHELNVRTYVYDEQGNPGVWFFSLDCDQPVAVEIARRAFHLPYEHAVMGSLKTGSSICYQSRRKTPGAVDASYDYELPSTTQVAPTGTLEWFLVERYLLFSSTRKGELFCGRIHHRPYQISQACCSHWSTEPLRLNGFSKLQSSQPLMLAAASVDVTVFPLRRC